MRSRQNQMPGELKGIRNDDHPDGDGKIMSREAYEGCGRRREGTRKVQRNGDW